MTKASSFRKSQNNHNEQPPEVATTKRRGSVKSVVDDDNKSDSQKQTSVEQLLPRSVIFDKEFKKTISRIVFGATIADKPGDAMKFVQEKVATVCPADTVGGFMLVQSRTIFCFIETESNASLELLSTLVNDENSALSDTKLFCFSDDCCNLLFSTWDCKEISVPRESNLDIPKEEIVNSVSEMYINIMKIAREISSTCQTNGMQPTGTQSISIMQESYATALPSNERLLHLCESSVGTTVEDFVQLHMEPMMSAFDESVWPPRDILDHLRWLE